MYEITVKRSSIFGMVPTNNSLQVSDLKYGKTIAVESYSLLLGGRKDMSGNRIVPIAEFVIDQPGSFQLLNPATANFNESDTLLIVPKPGFKAIRLILSTVFSGILFISGLVFSILSLVLPK